MKVTIKGIIKENREDLLIDRVVESLLGDTTHQVYHRFMGEIVCEVIYPMYREPMMYNRYEIKSHLNTFKEKGVEVIFFNLYDYNYMDDNYTIKDETILEKIYLKYYTILFTNILNDFDNYERKPIDESVENKEELVVDKISHFILDDTVVKMDQRLERVEIFFPFYESKNNYPMVNKFTFERVLNILLQRMENINTRSPEILTYIMYTYGVEDWDLMVKITKRYYSLLYDKIKELLESNSNTINESVENKEEQIINKISQYMLEDTEVEVNKRYERVYINYPSEGFNSYTIEKVLPLLLKRGYDINFVNYVQDTYSIKDWNLIVNISQRYYSLLYDKVKELLGSSNNFMNESVERKEETLNRIVDFMIQDTTWDVHMEYEEDWEYVEITINYPGGDRDDYKIDMVEKEWDMFHIGERDIVYIENNFGITERWIMQELYNRYINKLRPILYNEMINFGV